ncbi:hypothetical protein Pelo_16114 [Pelomyxa schiedti]|nr:hypothetical protein Pelo_16114 [Pelomyxa schiedti]
MVLEMIIFGHAVHPFWSEVGSVIVVITSYFITAVAVRWYCGVWPYPFLYSVPFLIVTAVMFVLVHLAIVTLSRSIRSRGGMIRRIRPLYVH